MYLRWTALQEVDSLLLFLYPNPTSISAEGNEALFEERVEAWNSLLQSRSEEFAKDTPQASVLLFSANAVVGGILNDPEAYGFKKREIDVEGGKIWEDSLHITSAAHRVLALSIVKSLQL